MRAGVDALELDVDTDAELWGYLQMAAHSLVNTDTQGVVSPEL
jgi:truncated hemoglobin YjbI